MPNGDAQLHLDGSTENQSAVPNPTTTPSHLTHLTNGLGSAVASRHNGNSRRSEDLVPKKIDAETLQREASRWLKGERERAAWRNAHRVVEWDGWEEGLVAHILHHEPPPTEAFENAAGPLLVPQLERK
jgi:hypothetical protein